MEQSHKIFKLGIKTRNALFFSICFIYVLYHFYDDSMGSYYESQFGHYNATLFFVVLQNFRKIYSALFTYFWHS